MLRALMAALLATVLVFSTDAAAKRPKLVSITVTDAAGMPIPNAWVRVPGTEGRRQVSGRTGVWEASMLYKYNGDPMFFLRGEEVSLTISAPGYKAQALRYLVRTRANDIAVHLTPMTAAEIAAERDDELAIDWLENTADKGGGAEAE